MSVVIEPADRAFALARDGVLLEATPSVVRRAATRDGRAGQSMLGQERVAPTEVSSDHWSHLGEGAIAGGLALQSARAELSARLDRASIPAGTAIEVATPGLYDASALGPMLALLRALGLGVAAFRDAAVITAAALDLPGDALVLELGLHHVSVTRVGRSGQSFQRNGQRVSSEHGGLMELHQHWLALAAEAMVLRTRFDPLHDAAIEQQLYDELPAALAMAATQGRALLAVRGPGGDRLEVELTGDQLALPAQPFMRGTGALLHSLRPAGTSLALVLPALLTNLPGIDSLLAEFSGCELVSVADGFAAAALSAALASGALSSDSASDDGPVRLLRRCERAIAFRDWPTLRSRVGAGAQPVAPTHMLHAGSALPMSAEPLEIGRAADALRGVRLPQGLAGVSRLHCSVRREGAQVVLVDHSRFGTFVNAERVAGRVVLRAGDRVRVGDPGVELSMIAVGDTHAPPPAN